MSKFAERLKQLRTDHHVTQTTLANFLNVSQNAVHNWENGKREPSIDVIAEICDYFAVPFEWMIGEEEPDIISSLMDRIHDNGLYFDGNEYTNEELEQIKKYADFLRSQRPVSDLPEEE